VFLGRIGAADVSLVKEALDNSYALWLEGGEEEMLEADPPCNDASKLGHHTRRQATIDE